MPSAHSLNKIEHIVVLILEKGTSSGYVNNGGSGLCFVNDSPTVFDVLESAGKTWNIFCGGWLLQSFTLLTQKSLWEYAPTKHFAQIGVGHEARTRSFNELRPGD
jgi:hypothetical protein